MTLHTAGIVAVIAVVAAGGLSAAVGLRRVRDRMAQRSAITIEQQGTRSARRATQRNVQRAVATTASGHQAAAPVAPPLVPLLGHGETPIGEGVIATRTDSGVTVHFDTELMRTRRPEKFERVVRATLPVIYGRRADSVLAAIPEGGIANQGDLLTVLPSRGVRLGLSGGWSLAVWPETRPGRDGPLVIRYRVAVVP